MHICYHKHPPHTLLVTDNVYRDTNSKKLDELSEQVRSLATGVKELSQTVMSALEGATSGSPDGVGSTYKAVKPLEHLPRKGFPDVQYWDRASWTELRSGKAGTKPDDPVLTIFIEDAAGNPVSKSKMQAVRNHANAYFAYLWNNKRGPKDWSHTTWHVWINFVWKLEEEFEFLRYCDQHWKSEQIFMNYYPQYRSSRIKNDTGKRKGRGDSEGGDTNEENPNGSKCPRVGEPTPPPTQPLPRPTRVHSLLYFTFIHAYDLQSNPL